MDFGILYIFFRAMIYGAIWSIHVDERHNV